jgi:hypothetical protein
MKNAPTPNTAIDADPDVRRDAQKEVIDRLESSIMLEAIERAASFRHSRGQHLCPGALPLLSKVFSEN